jgi:hypothetical protein
MTMRNALAVAGACALLLLCVLPAAPAEDVYFSLQGRVLESGTGKAISGAQVTVGTKSMVSDDAGFFKLDMPPGNYTVQVTADGYWNFSGNVSLFENTTRDFQLKKRPDATACSAIWALAGIPAAAVGAAGLRRRGGARRP